MSEKTALVLLAEGAEEIETVVVVDVLRRSNFVVTIAGVDNGDVVKCSCGIHIQPDVPLDQVLDKHYDVVALPGGMDGAKALSQSDKVGQLLRRHEKRGAYIAAICAAPIVLLKHEIGKGKRLTSHPSVKDKLSDYYEYTENRVEHDDKLITSRGPGTSFEFVLKIVEMLTGKEMADSMAEQLLLNMKEDGSVLRRALRFKVEGQRKKVRQKRTWNKQAEDGVKECGVKTSPGGQEHHILKPNLELSYLA